MWELLFGLSSDAANMLRLGIFAYGMWQIVTGLGLLLYAILLFGVFVPYYDRKRKLADKAKFAKWDRMRAEYLGKGGKP